MHSSHTKLTVMLMLAGLVLTCPAGFQAFGGDSELDRRTLRGLQGVAVMVETIAAEAERDGLPKRQVQTDVELRLRQSGIHVLSLAEGLTTPGRPYLYIHVAAAKRDGMRFYAYDVSVRLNQDVWLDRDLDIKGLGITTWDVGAVGSIGDAMIRDLRESVLDKVDQFINAYLAVNPEQAGAGRHSRNKENLVPDASIIRAVQWQLQEGPAPLARSPSGGGRQPTASRPPAAW